MTISHLETNEILQTFIYWYQVVDEGLEVVLSGWRGEGNKTVTWQTKYRLFLSSQLPS